MHLPRRFRIAGRESRVADNTEGIATNLCSPSRLSEVRVVEHVKDFPAKFDHLALSQFCTLNQRQVRVVEAWSNNHVSSQATEVINRFAVSPSANPNDRENHDGTGRACTTRPWIANGGRKPLHSASTCHRRRRRRNPKSTRS